MQKKLSSNQRTAETVFDKNEKKKLDFDLKSKHILPKNQDSDL